MSRHRLSFTEKRRRKLAVKTAHLDRLETRNTITEPISFTGLSLSALRGLAQMGIVSPDGGTGAALGLAQAAERARGAQGHVRRILAAPPRDVLAIGPGALARRSVGAAGGAAAVAPAKTVRQMAKQGLPNDWLAQTFGKAADSSSDSHGISSRWQPAS
jgi:hypothetical protein